MGYGAVAGAVAAVTFLLMKGLEHLLRSHTEARWYIFLVVLLGGVILAWLRTRDVDSNLDDQLAAAKDPSSLHRRKTAYLAASAIIAVGFGGSIGPEAGLVAVVAQLSIMVSRRIARSEAEQQVIGTAGSAAALAGLYGSPPGGATYGDDTLSPSKWIGIAAGISGFLAFLAVVKLAGVEAHGMELPELPPTALNTFVVAAVPAVLASILALAHAKLKPLLLSLLGKLGSGWRQTLIGSALLAALLAAFPLMRFSDTRICTSSLNRPRPEPGGSWLLSRRAR